MDEEKVRYFIEAERKKGTSTEELIFILYDNGVPVYEISNFFRCVNPACRRSLK